jgi:hypothetical protein
MMASLRCSSRAAWRAARAWRRSWIVAVLALLIGTGRVAAQADSAIILVLPSLGRATTCSTSVDRGVVTVSLDVNAGPLGDARKVAGTFDSTGRPLTLLDVATRAQRPMIESAAVRFDSSGRAVGGVGQSYTPADFTRDSTGAWQHRADRPSFRRLTRTQFTQAEQVSAWLWQRACRPTARRMPGR